MIELTGDETLKAVQNLAGFGARPVGSEANQAAADWIARAFDETGLHVERQTFDCPDWQDAGSLLELDGHRLEAAANMWSLPCDVTAPVVPVCTLAELEDADLAGRIALLTGELSERPVTPKGYPLYSIERDQRLVALLEGKAPAAALAVQHNRELERIFEDADFTVPSATITPAAARALLQRPGAPVHLRLDTQRSPSSASHLIGLKAGPRPARVLLCAHFDTKIGTPGAWDNASGTAALLAVARQLAAEPLACGLEFLAFNDEEYLGNDSQVYLGRRGGTLGDVIAVINLDGVGHALATTTIMLSAGTPELQEAAEAVTAAWPGVLWVEPWPESSHSIFAFQGIPSFAISNRPHSPVYHLAGDTADTLAGAKLAEAVGLATELARMLASRDVERGSGSSLQNR